MVTAASKLNPFPVRPQAAKQIMGSVLFAKLFRELAELNFLNVFSSLLLTITETKGQKLSAEHFAPWFLIGSAQASSRLLWDLTMNPFNTCLEAGTNEAAQL